MNQQPSISSLPCEMIFAFFSFLDNDNLFNCGYVCKLWRNLCKEIIFFRAKMRMLRYGNHKEGIKLFTKLLQLDSGDPEVYFYRAWCYKRNSFQEEQALQDLISAETILTKRLEKIQNDSSKKDHYQKISIQISFIRDFRAEMAGSFDECLRIEEELLYQDAFESGKLDAESKKNWGVSKYDDPFMSSSVSFSFPTIGEYLLPDLPSHQVSDPLTYYFLATLHAVVGNYRTSIHYCSVFLHQQSQNYALKYFLSSKIYCCRGWAWAYLKKKNKAIEDWKMALQMNLLNTEVLRTFPAYLSPPDLQKKTVEDLILHFNSVIQYYLSQIDSSTIENNNNISQPLECIPNCPYYHPWKSKSSSNLPSHIYDFETRYEANFQKSLLADYYYGRGLLREHIEQDQLAIQDFEKASLYGYGNLETLYFTMGKIYERMSNHTKAEDYYSKSLEVNERYTRSLESRAYLRRFIKNTYTDQDLLKDNYLAIERNPKMSLHSFRIVSIYESLQGNIRKALELISKGVTGAYTQGDAELLIQRARFYLNVRELEKAIYDYRQAIRIEPTNPKFFSSLGDLYYSNGEIENAKVCYSRAIEVSSGSEYQAINNRANLYLSLGKFIKASSQYHRALQHNQHNSIVTNYSLVNTLINESIKVSNEKQYDNERVDDLKKMKKSEINYQDEEQVFKISLQQMDRIKSIITWFVEDQFFFGVMRSFENHLNRILITPIPIPSLTSACSSTSLPSFPSFPSP